MRCPICGTEVPEAAHYCDHCGAPVYREQANVQTIILPQPDPSGGGRKKDGLRPALIAALIALPLILAALLAWRILAPKPQSAKQLHSYAVYTGPGGWAEAKRRASESGGYLAQIDDREEFDRLTGQLDAAGMRGEAFLLGARSEAGSRDYYWDDPSRTADRTPLNDEDAWCADLWADRDVLKNGDVSEERTIRLFFDDEADDWVCEPCPADDSRTADRPIVEYDEPKAPKKSDLFVPLGPDEPELPEDPEDPEKQEEPEPPTFPAPSVEVRVEDAVRYEYSSYESTDPIVCAVPKILLDGRELDSFNQPLYEKLNAELDKIKEFERTGVISSDISGFTYDWTVNGDVLSLWIDFSYHHEYWSWDVYNVCLSTGEAMSKQELLDAYGIPEPEYHEKAKLAMVSYSLDFFDQCAANPSIYIDDDYPERLRRTAEDSNVDAAMPFINKDGHLSIVGDVFLAGGQGTLYPAMLDLETFEPHPEAMEAIENPGKREEALRECMRLYQPTLRDYYKQLEEYPEQFGFGFVYIDDDEIPELCVFGPDIHVETVEIFTIRQGAVESCGTIGNFSKCAYGYRSGIVGDPVYAYGLGYAFYPLGKQDGTPIISFRTGPRVVFSDETIVYEIDGAEVSREEYTSRMQSYLDGGQYYSVSREYGFDLNMENIDAITDRPRSFRITGTPLTVEYCDENW